MIYTCTFSPALDYIMNFTSKNPQILSRAISTQFVVGGKGINASIILSRLGVKNEAITFAGGIIGEYISKLLLKEKVNAKIIEIPNESRVNVKAIFDSRYELSAEAPKISKKYLAYLEKTVKLMTSEDYMLLMGKPASGLNKNYFEKLMGKNKQAKFVLDVEGDVLKTIVHLKPFLIKPNLSELCQYFNKNIKTKKEIKDAIMRLAKDGAQNILVSLGSKGAVHYDGIEFKFISPAKGIEINGTGAGDSAVAGYIAAVSQNLSIDERLRISAAAGAATAFTYHLATKKEIKKFTNKIMISKY